MVHFLKLIITVNWILMFGVDMGLGKTLQSLLLYKSYHKPVGPTLILCKPVSILKRFHRNLNINMSNKTSTDHGRKSYYCKIILSDLFRFIYITQI